MRSVTVRLEDLRTMILNLGFVGENEHRTFRFDCKKMFGEYPSASVSLTVQPPAGDCYPAVVERDGDLVSWTVTDSDLIEDGSGELQLTFMVGDVKAKTCIARTKVERSLGAPGQIPTPIENWIEQAEEIISDAEDAATAAWDAADHPPIIDGNGYWNTWDSEEGAYVSTGVKAQGEDGDPGYSPTATVTKSGKVATISITDQNGTTTATVSDGEDGSSAIDDTSTAANKTWSAQKVSGEFSSLSTEINYATGSENTDAENVDLDVIDEDGNVIVRFEGGHIKTKEFNSSNIPDAKISNSTSDLVFSDNNGNVIGQFSEGHIQTKNFNSSEIVNGMSSVQTELHSISGTDYIKTFTYDPDVATKQTITGDFKAGDTILCHFSNADDDVTDISNTRWVTYSYLDANGIEQTLGQERGYNFARFILPESTTEIYGSFGTELLTTGSTYNCKFIVYKLSGYKRQPHIVTVGADGKRMFESVRDAMDSFNDNNAYNTYEIWIYPGTYNIMQDFTDAEIRETGFKGLWVKNGVTLIGIGHREQIILHAELDPDDYDRDTIRNNISTLNMSGNCGLQNLTVTNRYLRYAVHDDHMSGFHQEQTRIVENCKFESLDAASGGIGQAAYGAGGHNNKKLIIRNCDLGERLIIHNTQLMTVSMTAIVENSTAKQVTLTDNNNTGFTAKTRVEFNNCNFDYVLHDRTSNGTEPTMILCGTGTHNIKLDCEADTFYNFGDCVKFITNISAGQAVKLTGIRTPTATTSRDDIYGISIGYDGTYTYVQRQGYIADSVLGLTGLSVGDYVTLDSSGIVTETGATVSNAIGVVECVAETGTAFIKLLF